MTTAVALKMGLRCVPPVPTQPCGGETAKSAASERRGFKRSHVDTDRSAVQSLSPSRRNGDCSISAAISARICGRSSARKPATARRNPGCAIQCAE